MEEQRPKTRVIMGLGGRLEFWVGDEMIGDVDVSEAAGRWLTVEPDLSSWTPGMFESEMEKMNDDLKRAQELLRKMGKE